MSSELRMEVTSMETKVNYIFEMCIFFIKIVFVIFQYISLFQYILTFTEYFDTIAIT